VGAVGELGVGGIRILNATPARGSDNRKVDFALATEVTCGLRKNGRIELRSATQIEILSAQATVVFDRIVFVEVVEVESAACWVAGHRHTGGS
tara:strand:- start:25705 stop:25983 length:279 start_codon:yes stop_codon:yes gene_type:complete